METENNSIFEIVVKDMQSLKNIIDGLALNGYSIEILPIQKEFPKIGLDCFTIKIHLGSDKK